jgi:hypothetical protein
MHDGPLPAMLIFAPALELPPDFPAIGTLVVAPATPATGMLGMVPSVGFVEVCPPAPTNPLMPPVVTPPGIGVPLMTPTAGPVPEVGNAGLERPVPPVSGGFASPAVRAESPAVSDDARRQRFPSCIVSGGQLALPHAESM